MSSDNNGCLKRLFNYPPVEDVTLIILKALSFADPKLKIKSKKLTPPVKPLPPPPEKESAPSIALRNFVDTLLDDPQVLFLLFLFFILLFIISLFLFISLFIFIYFYVFFIFILFIFNVLFIFIVYYFLFKFKFFIFLFFIFYLIVVKNNFYFI